MLNTPERRDARPGLSGYYFLEGLNSLGTNIFFLGIFFHARLNHDFSDGANLMLAAAQGGTYVLATRAGGRFADRAGAERSIALGLAGMCLSLIAGWLLPQATALFATIALYSAFTALTWPALEAAIARAPGRTSLARRAGLYNVIWSITGATGFFFSGSLFTLDADAVFWVPLAAHALMLGGLAATTLSSLRTRPSGALAESGLHGKGSSRDREHEVTLDVSAQVEGVARSGGLQRADRREQGRKCQRGYCGTRSDRGPNEPVSSAMVHPREALPRTGESEGGAQRQDPEGNVYALQHRMRARYLLSARIANGLGYFLFGAFAALAPTIGEGLGLGARLSIWLVSTYLFARAAVFLVFWRWEGWEYRPGWVAAALASSPPALAATLLAPSATVVVAALALLGASSGIAYSASLHASLDREGGEGEGGGLHEWVIGLGVLLGPLAGAAGAGLFGGPAGAGGLVTALGAAAALAGLIPLARRPRRSREA